MRNKVENILELISQFKNNYFTDSVVSAGFFTEWPIVLGLS